MNLQEINQAIIDAEHTLRRADFVAINLAKLLKGRLRHIKDGWKNQVLIDLKRELKDFNSITGEWK